MGNSKSPTKLVFYAILSVILLFAMAQIIINLSSLFLIFELTLFLLFLVLTLASFITFCGQGERIFFLFFLLYLANTLVVGIILNAVYIVLLLLSLIGFFISIPKREETHSRPKLIKEPHSIVFDPPEESLTAEVVTTATKTKSTKKHFPGKYLASKQSNVYHAPKCEWAKKIKKKHHLWFPEKEDAWGKGYRAHKCVE